ncbi:MAG: uroporphyrinogen decarboxylase [Acidobacteria bacterium]|nr:uroporphyrinogen decarboxylase [Acidobacteriota bacterium]
MTVGVANEDRLLRACRRQPVDRPPVWLMRQAGRYLKEYQEVRNRVSFLQLCQTPDLAVEVSLQPYRILAVDAVILFSDILIPLQAMGAPVVFDDEGPRITEPVRTARQIEALSVPDPVDAMPYVFEIIRRLRQELRGAVPLIGFAGAPWTLATYLVEGGGSKNFAAIKALAYSEPNLLHQLLDKLARAISLYLNAQIEAGAQVMQLFDTWAGELSPEAYEEFALRYERQVIERLRRNQAPAILYINGCGNILEKMATSGADVLSLDWRVDLADARRRVGDQVALQGNVDPGVLLGSRERVEEITRETLNKGGGVGHILNLGHGILPNTPVENAQAFVAVAKKMERSL